MFVSMFLRCYCSDLFQQIPKLLCLDSVLELSLVDWALVCFLSFELNRSWSSIGLGSIIGFFGILAFL